MLDADALVAQLGQLQDGGYLSDAMFRMVVKTIAKSDDRFDWVGVYLVNDEGTELWLHNYVGKPTEHTRIPVGTGVCGRAVAEGKNLRVDDVTKEENYLACSPTVKSELVVLVRDGDRIFGQIDIDSSQAATFTDEDEAKLELIAAKLADQMAIEKK